MSISHNKFSAGVDIGGTFTDLALIDRDSGRLAFESGHRAEWFRAGALRYDAGPNDKHRARRIRA